MNDEPGRPDGGLAGQVVGWHALGVGPIGGYDAQMPVLDSGEEAHPVATTAEGVIERDPAVNRSLLLRLIAGVRGL